MSALAWNNGSLRKVRWLEGGEHGSRRDPSESQSYGPRPNRLSRSMAKVSGRFMYITAGAHLDIALYLYNSVNQSHIYQSKTLDPLYHLLLIQKKNARLPLTRPSGLIRGRKRIDTKSRESPSLRQCILRSFPG